MCFPPFLCPYCVCSVCLHWPQPRRRRRLQGGVRRATHQTQRRLSLATVGTASLASAAFFLMSTQRSRTAAKRVAPCVATCRRWLLTASADRATDLDPARRATVSTLTLLHVSVIVVPRPARCKEHRKAVWQCGVLRATHLTRLPLSCARCVSINSPALVVATIAEPPWTFHRACSLAPRQVAEFACASVANAQRSLQTTQICLARLVGMPTVTFAYRATVGQGNTTWTNIGIASFASATSSV